MLICKIKYGDVLQAYTCLVIIFQQIFFTNIIPTFSHKLLQVLSEAFISNYSEPRKSCQYVRRMLAFVRTFDMIYIANSVLNSYAYMY